MCVVSILAPHAGECSEECCEEIKNPFNSSELKGLGDLVTRATYQKHMQVYENRSHYQAIQVHLSSDLL